MSKIKYFEEESLPENAVKAAMELKINADNIFDPQSVFAANGDFKKPSFNKAYLVFILNPRKLQRMHIESVYDETTKKIYGEFLTKPGKTKNDKEEKVLRKYPVTSVTTEMDLNKTTDLNMFVACCKNRFVAGTEKAFPNPYFRIEVPEMRIEAENEVLDYIEEALVYTSSLKEEEIDDLALMLNISNFASKSTSDKKALIKKFAMSNPKDVVDAKNNKNMALIVSIKRAIDAGVIKNIRSVYTFADNQLGVTMEQVMHWAQTNPEVFEMINESVESKLKKEKKK